MPSTGAPSRHTSHRKQAQFHVIKGVSGVSRAKLMLPGVSHSRLCSPGDQQTGRPQPRERWLAEALPRLPASSSSDTHLCSRAPREGRAHLQVGSQCRVCLLGQGRFCPPKKGHRHPCRGGGRGTQGVGSRRRRRKDTGLPPASDWPTSRFACFQLGGGQSKPTPAFSNRTRCLAPRRRG